MNVNRITWSWLLLLAVSIATVAAFAGAYLYSTTVSSQSLYYQSTKAHLARLQQTLPAETTYLLGSSSLLSMYLSDEIDNVVNFSIGGETIGQMNSRLQGYSSLDHARVVVLWIGLNDLLQAKPKAENLVHMEQILGRLSNRPKVVVMGLQPVLTKSTEFNAGVKEVNSGYHNLCQQYSNCTYFDTEQVLASCKANHLYERDGIHFSKHGYQCLKTGLVATAKGV